MSFQVKTEKMIAKPAADVFHALQAGKLFLNCGADSSSMTIDFRVGGKYQIDFKNHELVNYGEFLEIIPNKKIVFSWCQEFGPNQKPDSQVSIELFEDGPKTRLVLVHTGFRTQAIADNHRGGWTDGTTDFGNQVEAGSLRMVRTFKASLEKTFAATKNPETFFAYMGELSKGSVDFKVGGKYQLPNENNGIQGEFLEIENNKRIVFSWLKGCSGPLKNSKVTMTFTAKDDGSTRVELIHQGLATDKDQSAHRGGWEYVTKEMAKVLGQ